MSLLSHPAAGWSVRHWHRSDYPQIETIFRDCLLDFPWRGGERSEVISLRHGLRAHVAFVAEEARAGIVGFLILDQGKAYVSHVFIDRDWRLCGVGSGLLKVARRFMAEPLKLDVDVQNVRAIQAYEALGWCETARVGRGSGRGEQIRLVSP